MPVRKELLDKIEQEKVASKEKFEEFKKQSTSEEDTFKLYKEFKKQQREKEENEHDETLYRKFGEGKVNGDYELIGVITHKGRSSDSGHYVAWCHREGDNWMKFDDDIVTEIKTQDVLNLSGGGDWHSAYYLLYRRLGYSG